MFSLDVRVQCSSEQLIETVLRPVGVGVLGTVLLETGVVITLLEEDVKIGVVTVAGIDPVAVVLEVSDVIGEPGEVFWQNGKVIQDVKVFPPLSQVSWHTTVGLEPVAQVGMDSLGTEGKLLL